MFIGLITVCFTYVPLILGVNGATVTRVTGATLRAGEAWDVPLNFRAPAAVWH